VIVGASHIERVSAFKAEHDSILVGHTDGVEPSHVTTEGVQPVAGRNLQILEARDRVNLIEFAPHVRPQLARDPPSGLAVDAVPDVPGRFIGERPDHRLAL
jgi:hypothetical protein